MRTFLFSALILVAANARAAELQYTVTLDTSSSTFSLTPPGPLSVAFEFADGSGTGDGNNSVTLSDFQFGGGSASGSPFQSGSVTGDLSSSIVFTDAAPTNIFFQGLLAGSTFRFSLRLTTNVDAGGIPDEFFMSILDSTLSPIPTTSSSPLFPIIAIAIDSLDPTVTTFGSDPNQTPAAGGFLFFGAPSVDLSSPIPEPASVTLCAAPVAWFIWCRRRRSASRRKSVSACR